MPELAVEGVTVRFGGLLAVDDVSLEVPAGSVTGLIGPNGAGKTTLFDVITGLRRPERGRVLLHGRDVTTAAPHIRSRLGMARTFQRLELFGSLTARENVQTAAEARRDRRDPAPARPPVNHTVRDLAGRAGRYLAGRDWLGGARAHVPPAAAAPPSRRPTARTIADGLLERVGLADVADTPADLLPVGLARLLELARALATRPRVLLLDEPSAGLDRDETAALGRVLASLAADGLAVLLVEHDMELVMRASRQVVVLDTGVVIARGTPEQIRADDAVQQAYLGAPAPATPAARPRVPLSVVPSATAGSAPSATAAGPAGGAVPGAPLLELEDVRAGYGRIEVLHGVRLIVPSGSVTALLGPNGAGKSTLLKVASGRLAPMAGRVRYDGADIVGVAPERLSRRGLCTVPEGRAVFANLTVAENLRMFGARSAATTAKEMEEQSYRRFPVLERRRRQLAGRLSGGEQQMLGLARALGGSPKLLLLDELSMGLAPLVVQELYEVVAALAAEERVSVLLVEQFAQTALSIADAAAVLVNGRLVEHGTPDAISGDLARAYLGGS